MSRKRRCKKYYTITEYYNCGDLYQISSLNEAKKWAVARDLVEGLIHIHNQGFIHQDLKPDNIYIDDQNEFKAVIGDFGVIAKEGFGSLVGTCTFWCPEKILSNVTLRKNLEKPSDAWSLGLILYSVFKGDSFAVQYENVIKAGRHHFGRAYNETYAKVLANAETPIEKLILKLLYPLALGRIPLTVFRECFMRLFNARTRLTPFLSSEDIASILIPAPELKTARKICAEYLAKHFTRDMAALSVGSMRKIAKTLYGKSIYLFKNAQTNAAFLNTGIVLGEGSSKEVLIVMDVSSGTPKAITKSLTFEPVSLFPKEGPVLQPEWFGSKGINPTINYAILPLCDRKDLFDALTWDDDLSHEDKVRIAQDVIETVLYMHSKGYLYEDLMLENIFLKTDSQGLVRGVLGDLGCVAPKRRPTYSGCKANWAPEKLCVRDKHPPTEYAEAMDAWLVGLALHEMFVCRDDYQLLYSDHIDEPELYIAACKTKYENNLKSENPLHLLINELLNPNPEARITLVLFLEKFKTLTS